MKYYCELCRYEYDEEVEWEDLPDEFECPVCGVGKDEFTDQC